jgi:magnesium transporter
MIKMDKVQEKTQALADPIALAQRLAAFRAVDAVEALNIVDAPSAARVLTAMPIQQCIEVFDVAGLDRPHTLIELLPEQRAVAILEAIAADRRADIFRKLSAPDRSRLSETLPVSIQTSLKQLLAYPPDTAGGMMTSEFVTLQRDWLVDQALQHIRKVARDKETIYALFIVEPATAHLSHVVSLRDLILAEPAAKLESLGRNREPLTVAPLADRRQVALLISKYDLLAIPVVDRTGDVIGIVTVDDVIDAIVEDATEQVQRFGGLESLDQPYLRIGFLAMIKKRAGWLCALFLSEMLTASAMQHFEGELEKAVVLTLFIPLIMSSGGNSGSQATSLIIRALALGEIRLRDWWRIAVRELPAGLVLGGILGVIGIIRISLWQQLGFHDYGAHWVLIAATVAVALVGIVTFGSVIGSMLPFLLKRLGFDPATASAPFVATLVDVTGLIIYFSIAYVILSGTIL